MRKILRLGCLLALTLGAVGAYVVGSMLQPTIRDAAGDKWTDAERRAYLVQHGIHLPRPADDLQVYYEAGFPDWSLWTTFRTDEKGVRYFVGGENPDPRPDPDTLASVLDSPYAGQQQPWWTPPRRSPSAFTSRDGLCAGVATHGQVWFGCVKD